MENKRKALGKGLEQLFNSETINFDELEHNIVSNASLNDIQEIPIIEIRSNPYQPRQYFNEESLNELADSIKEHGIIEPILVKKSIHGYELVAGERRTRAAKIAGLDKVPAVVKEFSDQEMMDIALLENIQREDLSPIEVAEGFKKYIDNTGLTQEEISKKFGKSRSYITNLLGLLNLPKSVKDEINHGKISMSQARVLSKIDDEELIMSLTDKILTEGISVRELERISNGEEIPKKRPIKKSIIISNKYNSYENILRDKLGTKVLISKNKISIPFDSDGDLDRILEILKIDLDDE